MAKQTTKLRKIDGKAEDLLAQLVQEQIETNGFLKELLEETRRTQVLTATGCQVRDVTAALESLKKEIERTLVRMPKR